MGRRRVGRAIAWVVGGAFAAGCALLLTLQIDAVAGLVFRTVARIAVPREMELEVDGVSGSWLTGVQLRGVSILAPSVGVRAHLDTVSLAYRPLGLRPGRLRFEEVEVAGITAEIRRTPPVDPSPPSTAAPKGGGGGLDIELGSVQIRRARIAVSADQTSADSPDGSRAPADGPEAFRIEDLQASLREVRAGSRMSVESWSVETPFSPGGMGPAWGRIAASGALTSGAVRIDTLDLSSPRSRLSGRGRIPIEGAIIEPRSVEWSLTASPLVLADLQGLAPVAAVTSADTLRLDWTAAAEGDSAVSVLRAETSQGGRAAAEAAWGRSGGSWGGRWEARATALDLRRFLGNAVPVGALDGEIDGRIHAVVEGGSVDELQASVQMTAAAPEGELALAASVRRSPDSPAPGWFDSVTVALGPIRWAEYGVQGGRVSLESVQGGVVGWQAALDVVPMGRVSSQGRLGAPGSGASRRVSGEVRLESVSLVGVQSVLSGRGGFEVTTGTSPRGWARMALDSSSVSGWPLDSLRFSAEWDGAPVRLKATVGGPGGDVGAQGGLHLDDRRGRLELDRVDFTSLGAPSQDVGGPSVRVGGRLQGTVQWPLGPGVVPELNRLDADLALVVEQVQGLPQGAVDSVTSQLGLRHGHLQTALSAALGGGGEASVRVSGPIADSLDAVLQDGFFTSVDLSTLVAGAPSTDLNGRLGGRLRRGASDGALSLGLQLELDSSNVTLGAVDGVRGDVRITPDTLHARLQGDVAGGFIAAQLAGAGFRDLNAWELLAELDHVDVASLSGGAVDLQGVTTRMTAAACGSDGIRMQLEVAEATGWGIPVDTVYARAALDSHTLAVDTLWMRTALVDADVGGELPLDFLKATQDPPRASVPGSSSPVRRLALDLRVPESGGVLEAGVDTVALMRNGSGRLDVECRDMGCDLASTGALGEVLLGPYSAINVRLDGRGRVEPGLRIVQAAVEGMVGAVSTPFLRVKEAHLAGRSVGGAWELDAGVTVDDGQEAHLGMRAEQSQGVWRVGLDSVDVRLDEERWALSYPAMVMLGPDGVTLDSLQLEAPGQRIRASVQSSGGEPSIGVTVDSLDLRSVFGLLDRPGLSGTLNGELQGEGAGIARRFDGSADADITFRGRPLHRVSLEGGLQEGRVSVGGSVFDALGRSRLTLVPREPTGVDPTTDWAMGLVADSLPLSWAAPYLARDVVSELKGVVNARVDVRWDSVGPSLRGPLEVAGGAARLPGLGLRLSDGRLVGSAEGRRVSIDTLLVRSGGELRGSGWAAWPADSDVVDFDVALSADRFRAIDTRDAKAVIAGELAISGNSATPRVRGEVQVLEGEYRVAGTGPTRDVREVSLTDEDWAILRSRFGVVRPRTPRPLSLVPTAADVDVQVSLGRNVWLRRDYGPELALQFTGDLAVTTGVDGAPVDVQGSVEAIPGRSYVEEFSRRFTMEEGTIEFVGPVEETRINVTSAYSPPAAASTDPVEITLRLQGSLDDLVLELSSDPPLDNTEIVSYLATGRAQGVDPTQAETGNTSLAGSLVTSGVNDALERLGRNEAGLDVVEIRQDGLGSTNLVAGKYVTPRLFVGFRQAVAVQRDEAASRRLVASGTEAEAELQALNWLVVHLQGGASSLRFFLEASYGW